MRTGTSLMMLLLCSHPEINCMSEMLLRKSNLVRSGKKIDPNRALSEEERIGYLSFLKFKEKNKESTENDYLDYIFLTERYMKVLGFKLMHGQLPDENLNILRKYNTKFLMVVRKNVLQTIVSRARVSKSIIGRLVRHRRD